MDGLVELSVTSDDIRAFRSNGFFMHPTCIFTEKKWLQAAVDRLESILNGEYDTGVKPVKIPALSASMKGADCRFRFCHVPLRESNQKKPMKTLHLINAWHSDALLRRLVTSPSIGRCVTELMGWQSCGCRLGQDQVWIKPPGSGPLSFHRDTTYFDVVPKEVCTVWISFGALRGVEAGPLEYCRGSHLWGEGRRGSANQFFDPDYKTLLRSAALLEDEARGLTGGTTAIDIHIVQGAEGCCSIHDGRTWHGSGANSSGSYRAGMGVHYIRGDASLDSSVPLGKLWQPYLDQGECAGGKVGELSESMFPIVCPPSNC